MTKPIGMEHHKRDFVNIKIPHFIVKKHQEAFEELENSMRHNPDSANIYAAFLTMLPLQMKQSLSSDMQKEIKRFYRL